jgi:hypothetical protein
MVTAGNAMSNPGAGTSRLRMLRTLLRLRRLLRLGIAPARSAHDQAMARPSAVWSLSL